jgi:hypothetical protein
MGKKQGYWYSSRLAVKSDSLNGYPSKGLRNEPKWWSRTIVLNGIVLLTLFFMFFDSYANENSNDLFTVHPSLVELDTGDNELSIGFGLLEGQGDKNKSWNVFPVRLVLKSGGARVALYLNGFSFLTREGLYFGREQVIRGVHRGDVVSVGGNVTVEGLVEGNVWTFGANVVLKTGSKITGDVVSLGGKITVNAGAVIIGNKQAVPGIYIPFLGLLTSPQSAETLLFVFDLLGILLFILLLFLITHFGGEKFQGHVQVLSGSWQMSLIYLVISLILIPILVALLLVSLVGIILIPILFILIILFAYLGFLAVAVRIGNFLIKADDGTGMKLFVAGLLGFALLKGPGLLGRLLTLLTSDILSGIGGILKVIGSILVFLAVLLGFGSSLLNMKKSSDAN